MAIDLRVGEVPAGGGTYRYHVLEEQLEGHVIWCNEIGQHLDLCITEPSLAAFMERMGRYGRTTIITQPRGVGLSDPGSRLPTLEEQVEDLFAVMDAEGVTRATLVGMHLVGPVAALAAARRPDRVQGLVLLGCMPVGPLVDDHAAGWTPDAARACVELYQTVRERWGKGFTLEIWDPALCTPLSLRVVGMMERCSTSRAMGSEWFLRGLSVDARDVYAQVRVPTLVLSVTGGLYPPETADALAAMIPGAEHRPLPPAQLGDSVGTAWSAISDAVASLALGPTGAAEAAARALTTVLFTDVVDSTDHLARIGDTAWEAKLDAHDRIVAREATRVGGRVVETTGDGTLCELPGPAAAVRCAQAVGIALAPEGLRVRAGVHTGECLRRGPALMGLTVHVGARVAALAGPGQVMLTDAARRLAEDAQLAFVEAGVHELKGVPGRWTTYATVAATDEDSTVPAPPATPRRLDRVALVAARRAPRAVRALNRVANDVQRRRLLRTSATSSTRAEDRGGT